MYEVLTDYERLPEFVPNLAVTELVPLPEGSPPNLVRLRQVPSRAQQPLQALPTIDYARPVACPIARLVSRTGARHECPTPL